MDITHLLFILLPVSIVVHIIEEFVFPGGFIRWYKLYKPEIAESIKPKILAITNILLVIGSANSIVNGVNIISVIMWLIFASIIGYNIYYHVKGVILTKVYSPGIISSLILYLPLTLFGYCYFMIKYNISARIIFLCILTGPSMQMILNLNHKRRTKKLSAENKTGINLE
jgi:hypothetical protein